MAVDTRRTARAVARRVTTAVLAELRIAGRVLWSLLDDQFPMATYAVFAALLFIIA